MRYTSASCNYIVPNEVEFIKQTIYLDVLVLINSFVTYFLLLSTKTFLHAQVKRKRLLIACALGGAYSLIILATGVPAAVLTALKLVMSVVLVLVAFPKSSKKVFFKTLIFFYLVNFIYAGFMFALWYFISPIGMLYKNGVVYFNVSAVVLCLSTVAAFLSVELVNYCIAKNVDGDKLVTLQIAANNKEVLLKGFVDTGNHLVDIVTGLPVLVCDFEGLKPLFPEEILKPLASLSLDEISSEYWKKRLRIIPIEAVTGQSIMLAFKPDSLEIGDEDKRLSKSAVVGISMQKMSDGEFSALLPKELI